jgi:hypothetical protein
VSSAVMRRKRFDNAAIADRAASTLVDQAIQLISKSPEIGDFPVHLFKMFSRDRVDGIAGLVLFIGYIQKRSDLLEREAQVTGAPNEAQTAKVL